MAITHHIQGWASLHPLNSETINSESRSEQEEKNHETIKVSLHEGSDDVVKFCNLVVDPVSELLHLGSPTDIDCISESCQASTVSLQSRSYRFWRIRTRRITIIIIIAILILFLVLIFSLILGILLSKHKTDITQAAASQENITAPYHEINAITIGFTETTYSSCGGLLNDSQGSFSSPNYPHFYPPNSHCAWVLEAGEGHLVQLKIVVLDVEGHGSCLLDWLELKDGNTTNRFCGTVAPTTVISSSHWLKVNFVSDDSISAMGFLATYRMIVPSQGSCSWDEFLCDERRCLLLPALCDGIPDCTDQMDEKNCSQKEWDCGGYLGGFQGAFYSPNHPEQYPGKMVCRWLLTVPDGFFVRIQFHNFSLEMERGCKFDYIEIHDGAGLGTANVMGRFCGSQLPPILTSSGPQMSVLFVADEEVSGLGFYATYESINASANECNSSELRCGGGQCLSMQLVCDGWVDCPDGKDELDCPDRQDLEPATPCQPLRVPLCKGFSYTLTVFPNLWMSLHDQPAANELLKGYKGPLPYCYGVLVKKNWINCDIGIRDLAVFSPQHQRLVKILQELPCFPALRPFFCALLVPSCSVDGGALQPCRSVCLNAEYLCVAQLHQLGLPWSFNCDLFPTRIQQPDCVIP